MRKPWMWLLPLTCALWTCGATGQTGIAIGQDTGVGKPWQDAVLSAAKGASTGTGELVSGSPATLRFPVAHLHGRMFGGACYGYLYFTRDTVRYEVVGPVKWKDHSFERKRSEIVQAGAPHGFADAWLAGDDFRMEFQGGEVHHFAHVDDEQVQKRQTKRFMLAHLRPWQSLDLAYSDFDKAVVSAGGSVVGESTNALAMGVTAAVRGPGASAASTYTTPAPDLQPPTPPTGFYADPRIDFDVLDGVALDPRKGTLMLFGRRAGGGTRRPVPYLDYLAAAIESNDPTFSLEWTAESRRSVDQAFNMPDQDLTDRLAGQQFDAGGRLTTRGEWWFRMLGADVHAGMDKMSFWEAVFPAAGYPHAPKVLEVLSEVVQAELSGKADEKVLDPDGHTRTHMEHFMYATIGIVHPFDQEFLNVYGGSLRGDPSARDTLLSWSLRGLARAFKMDDDRYVGRYLSLERGGTEWSVAFGEAVNVANEDIPAVEKNAGYALFHNQPFIHVPPEIMREALGINPVVVPVYTGMSPTSLLARVAFDGDVFGKNLMDMPEIKSKVPSYRTYFEWRQTVDRAPAAEGHTWFAPDGFELVESADGQTVRFGRTAVRIHLEKYETRGSGRQSVADPLLEQYADELTALYDPLAAEFPVLLDLRESMKVMAVADWLKTKGVKLSFPAEGRGAWNPPAQYPGLIHMELAVKEARVGEVMSASGGIDFRVDQNWKLLKQRLDEIPVPPANPVVENFDPASGKFASSSVAQAEANNPSGPGGASADDHIAASGPVPKLNPRPPGQPPAGFRVAATNTDVFSCYRADSTTSGCLEIRNNSTRRIHLYVQGLPGVQCSVEAGSVCSIPIALGQYGLQMMADDESGFGPTVGAQVNLTSAGVRLTLEKN